MTTYREFKYEMVASGKWKIVYPGGHKVVRPLADEESVKRFIDEIIIRFDAAR